ncbi:conserved hypothetical protein [Methylobacterium nodulans ORS 2060]|uniref:Putative Flp pilus-assembly TadG-like N-terminal domain-containing protein n=2 Tax=Methylobacterium nodulans TaxID=114616 RepID=B8IDZ3_METNO|nr:conserved hypothetical protein [Methylobacterium nodulans ORS 2060]
MSASKETPFPLVVRPSRSFMHSLLSQCRSLWADSRGIMLPYVSIMLVVIAGLSLLGLDGIRYMSLQTQMQAAADALALAGAAELNGKAGARARAQAAIDNLLSNGLSGMGVTAPVQVTVQFKRTLPVASQLPTGGTAATADSDAHFVIVDASPITLNTIFPASFVNSALANTFTSGAQSVAGMNQSICSIPPVYLCNPWEGTGIDLTTALATPGQARRQLKLLNDGTSSPGHFGWLVPPDNNVSASNLQDWISRTTPKTCYRDGYVSLNTGAKQSALAGFNTRFDIGADATHVPDVNVRKGRVSNSANWCNAQPDTDRALALPQDSTFTNFASGGAMGDGKWDCQGYWDFNHHTTPRPTANEFGQARVCGDPNSTTFSRYEIYRYEIINSKVTDWSRGTVLNNWTAPPPYSSSTGENGQPLCTGTTNAVSGRRVLPIAVINCTENATLMGNGANADNIPVAGFAKFFITEPVNTTGAASDRQLIGEFTGEVTALDAKIFQNVKLYR